MSPSTLLRISGLALVLAAAMFVVAEMLAFSIFLREGDGYDLRSFATSNTFILQSLLTLLAGTLLLGGLVGLYVRQSEAAGKLGLTAFLLAFLGTALVTGDFYVNTVVTPMVAMEVPAFLDNPLSGFLQVWLPVSFGILTLSWLLLGVSIVRTRVYPRGASWLLLIGAVVALAPLPLDNLLFDVALAWLGFALLKERERPPRRQSTTPRRQRSGAK
jgi:hypothetical protein